MKRALAEGNGDRAFQSPRIECHRGLPLELERECALKELGPKSLVRRRRNRRATALPPLEYQLRRLGALLNAPGNLDATRRPAQGAIFQRVGRELVNGKREGFRGLGVKTYRGPADTHLLAFSRIIGQQLLDREVFEINAALGIAGHQRLGSGECVEPAIEMGSELLDRRTAIGRATADRADHAERVADPMLKLGQQQALPLLGAGHGGDVDKGDDDPGDEIVDAAIGQDTHDVARAGGWVPQLTLGDGKRPQYAANVVIELLDGNTGLDMRDGAAPVSFDEMQNL